MAYCPFRQLVAKCGLLAALALFSLTANAQQPVAVVINEYPVSGVGGGIFGFLAGPIASGSDGALWFPVVALGRVPTYQIFRITTAGVITTYAPPSNSGSVGGITAGPDGIQIFTKP